MSQLLRPYQARGLTAIRQAIRQGHRRILVVCPTGGGKTVMFAEISRLATEKGNPCLVLAHREELIDQAAMKLVAVAIKAGIIKAGRHADPSRPVQVASIASLARRALPRAAVVIVDEAHHATSATWSRVLAAYSQAIVLGWTATPQRADGRGLGAVFDELIQIVTPAALIADAFLLRPRILAPSSPDLVGIRTVAGDFDAHELELRCGNPKLMGSVADHWAQHLRGKRAMLFAVSIRHSEQLVAALTGLGCRAAHLDGTSSQRGAVVEALRSGDLDVVSNVGLFAEGVDIPALDAVIVARPTQSLALWLQQVGRAMRPAPGKTEALVLDHAGNCHRHGFPDEDRAWSLADRPKKTKGGSAPVKTCSECFRVVPAGTRTCPDCGFAFAGAGREVKVAEGELTELDADGVPRKQIPFDRLVADLAFWLGRARERGYKAGWAAFQFQARYHRFPDRRVRTAAGALIEAQDAAVGS